MTNEMKNLRDLVEKIPDADLLREMIEFAGAGDRGADRGGLRREERGAPGSAQWLPRARLGDPGGYGRAAHPEASQGELLPRLFGTAPDGREGADCGGAGGVCAGRLHPFGGRTGASHGDERHLQELGQPALCRDRREGEGLPQLADRGRLTLPVGRRHLRQSAPERPHRAGGGDRCGWRQRRWPARDFGDGYRPLRGRDVLDCVPAQACAPRFARRSCATPWRTPVRGPARGLRLHRHHVCPRRC